MRCPERFEPSVAGRIARIESRQRAVYGQPDRVHEIAYCAAGQSGRQGGGAMQWSNERHPDDAYRQPAAPARADPALCRSGPAARRSTRPRSTGSARRRSRRIVDKQIEAGVDIGNNGEQQREAFFLYVRHRMSGFGGSWQRWPRGDVERYPLFKTQMARDAGGARGGRQLPAAKGDRRGPLRRRQRTEGRMRRFPRRARRAAERRLSSRS